MIDQSDDIPEGCPARDRCNEDRLQREALHAHHRLLAEQIAQTVKDYRTIHDRMDATDARLQSFEAALSATSASTARIDANTAGLVATFQDLSGGLRVLGWIGSAGKGAFRGLLWLALVGGLILAVWDRFVALFPHPPR